MPPVTSSTDRPAPSLPLVLSGGAPLPPAGPTQPAPGAAAAAAAVATLGRAAVPSRNAIANMLSSGARTGVSGAALHDAERLKQNEAVRTSVMYLGMNHESNDSESTALAAKGGMVRVDRGVNAALDTPQGVRNFVATLNLDRATAANVESAISNSSQPAITARIAESWAAAYQGGEVPARLVLSGHSTGGSVYGHRGEEYSFYNFSDVQALASAMPAAASRIEHIQLAGCNTAEQATTREMRQEWTSRFPSVKTMMAYNGPSPTWPQNSQDIEAWRAHTAKGPGQQRQPINHMSGNATVWTKPQAGTADGPTDVQSNVHIDVAAAKLRMAADAVALNGRLAGLPTSRLRNDTEVYDAYVNCQRLRASADAPAESRGAAAKQLNQLFGLREPKHAISTYYAQNQTAHDQGFACLGKPAPDFHKMSRKDGYALAQASQAECRARLNGPNVSETDKAKLTALDTALEEFKTFNGLKLA